MSSTEHAIASSAPATLPPAPPDASAAPTAAMPPRCILFFTHSSSRPPRWRAGPAANVCTAGTQSRGECAFDGQAGAGACASGETKSLVRCARTKSHSFHAAVGSISIPRASGAHGVSISVCVCVCMCVCVCVALCRERERGREREGESGRTQERMTEN